MKPEDKSQGAEDVEAKDAEQLVQKGRVPSRQEQEHHRKQCRFVVLHR